MPLPPIGFVRELLQEVESLKVDLESLHQRQASMNLRMNRQNQLADILDSILNNMSRID